MGPSATPVESLVEARAPSAETSAPSKAFQPLRSHRKRLAFTFAIALGICSFFEFAAFVAYGLVDARPFSYSRVQADRDQLLHSGSDATRGPTSGQAALPDFLRSKSLHPYVGYVATPAFGASQSGTLTEDPPTHFGFYDSNPIRKRSPDTVIVAVVGGSVAYGFCVPASEGARAGIDVLREQLVASPRFAGKQIVLLRLALSGYKQPQQLMTIGYLLSLGAEFDVVIDIDGFNEVALHPAENAKTGTFAAYPRMWSFQTSDGRQLPGKYAHLNFIRRNSAEIFSQPWLKHSVTANLIWKLRDRKLAREIYESQQALLADNSGEASYESTGPSRPYANEDAMMDDLVSIWKNSSLQLHRLCRANGAAYYHILQPNQYVAGSKPLTADELANAYDANQPYRHGAEVGYPRLIAAGDELKNEGVHFANLSRAFADENQTLYVDSCCHFNDRGYGILAHRIVSEILSDYATGAGRPVPAQASTETEGAFPTRP